MRREKASSPNGWLCIPTEISNSVGEVTWFLTSHLVGCKVFIPDAVFEVGTLAIKACKSGTCVTKKKNKKSTVRAYRTAVKLEINSLRLTNSQPIEIY